jgi:serine/threonine-protein kinase
LFWYSSEFIPGRSLAAALERDGPMELDACLRIVEQVAQALGHAHRVGVVHADLKPANVLVDAAGDAHVTDFWVPWVLGQRHALAVRAPTTRGGVARHRDLRFRRDPGPAADQYALAALVYQCLGGSTPGAADAMAALVSGPAPAAIPPLSAACPDVPSHVSLALERALRPSPAARFASVLDFAGALEAPHEALVETRSATERLPLLTVDTEWQPEPPSRPPRRRWVLGGLLGLAAVGAALGAWVLGSDSSAGEPSAPQSAPGAAALLASDSALPPSTVAPSDSTAPPLRAPAGRASPGHRASPSSSASSIARAPGPAPRAVASAGRLFVNSTPWGEVYVDDVHVGNTPRPDIAVAPGVHRVRVVRDAFQPFELTIRVASGEVVRLTDIVLKELAP